MWVVLDDSVLGPRGGAGAVSRWGGVQCVCAFLAPELTLINKQGEELGGLSIEPPKTAGGWGSGKGLN